MNETKSVRPEEISMIASSIKEKLETSILSINDIYEKTHVLSINSRIEAARVGEKGKGFKIVAESFSQLNGEIAKVANELDAEIKKELMHLRTISDAMAKDVRAQRLSQICISVMDVIDRNLYERSCDVRWWATDSSVVEVLKDPSEERARYAEKRLETILASYTVYLDIVVADRDGVILANGRPGTFKSRKANVATSRWFLEAQRLKDGQEYAMESTHKSRLVNDEAILAYSAAVFDNQEDKPLGILGILFNWNGLVHAVLERVTKQDLIVDIVEYKIPTQIWILDEQGTILADSDEKKGGGALTQTNINKIIDSKDQGYSIAENEKYTEIVSWGYSPGFETYRSDWYCAIRQVFEN